MVVIKKIAIFNTWSFYDVAVEACFSSKHIQFKIKARDDKKIFYCFKIAITLFYLMDVTAMTGNELFKAAAASGYDTSTVDILRSILESIIINFLTIMV